jgi:hypothetical protein
VTILSTIGQYLQAAFSGFKPPATKPANEFLQFFEAFPFQQVLSAALAEGVNPLLDVTAAVAITSDVVNSFFAGKTVAAAAASAAVEVGVSPIAVAAMVFTPDPVTTPDPTQFSRGGH